jgi:hypothetical protein
VAMQTWEYSVIYLDPDDFQDKLDAVPLATRALNRMGQQGWEALAVLDMDKARKAILFKRPGRGEAEGQAAAT